MIPLLGDPETVGKPDVLEGLLLRTALRTVQRRGIGRALVAAGLQHESTRSVPVVFLEGDPGCYARLGFQPGGQHGLRRPSLRTPEAAFQVFLQPSHQPWMTGTLVYPEVFWRHDAVGLREPGA